MPMYKILIFDCSGKTRPTLISALEDRANLTSIKNESEFQEEIKTKQFDVIFLDNDSINGRTTKILENMRSKDPYLPIIMTSETEKAEMIVQTSIEKVNSHMSAVKDQTKWMYDRELTKVLDRPNDRSSIVYSVTNAPWPVMDRDAVFSFTYNENNTAEFIVPVR